MFGALNRFISRLDGDAPDQRSKTGTACGFQVLRNKNTELPLEPWFDFIIGINGRTLVFIIPNCLFIKAQLTYHRTTRILTSSLQRYAIVLAQPSVLASGLPKANESVKSMSMCQRRHHLWD